MMCGSDYYSLIAIDIFLFNIGCDDEFFRECITVSDYCIGSSILELIYRVRGFSGEGDLVEALTLILCL